LKLYLENVSNILPDKTERKAIRARTLELLSEAPWLAEYGKNLFLIGGTAKTLGRLLCTRTNAKFEDGMCFQAEELEALYRAYRTPGKKKIRSIIDAAPDRLHSFLPGLIAYHCIAEQAGTQTITITVAGVRDGLALSVLEDMEEEG
jgi:exopolyphosphatase/guanosine-5'-triphosphate,3'-diphosphate pyrophosphatase